MRKIASNLLLKEHAERVFFLCKQPDGYRIIKDIVLYGLSKDGKKLQVADCGGRARNGWWNVDTVFNEARSNAGANGPFWAISK